MCKRTKILATLSLLLFLLAGCTTGTWSLFGGDPGLPEPSVPLQSAGELLEMAGSSGMLQPVTWVSGLFLLSAIPAFFLLSKKSFVSLLLVGVGLAVLPVVVLAVMDHLVIPVAICAGLLGLGGVLFFLGRLWDRYVMKKRCHHIADIVLDEDHPKQMSSAQVADLLLDVTGRKKKKKESEHE